MPRGYPGTALKPGATHKVCAKCQKTKLIEQFNRDRGKKDGRNAWCKQCTSARHAQWRVDNADHSRTSKATWNRENRERKREANAAWRKNNPERLKETERAWREKNATHVRESNRKWRKINAVRVRKNKLRWLENNGSQYAWKARARLVAVNSLGSASQYKCVRCNARAEHWHHWSYEQEHWASVAPVCVKCHVAHHHGKLEHPLSYMDAVKRGD